MRWNIPVRYKLASSTDAVHAGDRIVTFGQTISTTSEKRTSCLELILFNIDQAASIAITVDFPEPVAILHAYR